MPIGTYDGVRGRGKGGSLATVPVTGPFYATRVNTPLRVVARKWRRSVGALAQEGAMPMIPEEIKQ